MNTVYKSDMIYSLSEKLNIPQTTVKSILDSYIGYVKKILEGGNSCSFLNICYFSNKEEANKDYMETLAYTCNNISKELVLSKDTVLITLLTLEEQIVDDLKKFYPYVVHTLFRVSFEEYCGSYKVRLNKSSSLDSNIRIHIIGSFKRRVEG